LTFAFQSCSVQKKIAKSATENVLSSPVLQTAHVGISIYEPNTKKYWYDYQGDHYFVPASNTKIPTCYAAMKYLGDSLVGLRYGIPQGEWWTNNTFVIDVTGDPTFLHGEFPRQPVFDFLKRQAALKKTIFGYLIKKGSVDRWGNGWSWNDYESDYMAERNALPMFGNVINVRLLDSSDRININTGLGPKFRLFKTGVRLFDSLVNNPWPRFGVNGEANPKIRLTRNMGANEFSMERSNSGFRNQIIPFVTEDANTALQILRDTLNMKMAVVEKLKDPGAFAWMMDDNLPSDIIIHDWKIIHSQPTDSLLKPMMHRSDNFFAEQSLLMVSNERLGYMNDTKIIDTLLKTDFKDLPQKPRWADGSGLSRYNLFSPRDFVGILDKMRTEFGMERIKIIFPTGGEGTLSNYFKTESGYMFAKTGTLSGVVALSGFLYTKKNKLLIFSALVNNHNGSATDVRRAMEKFFQGIRNKY
jgi:D-alanyl-D-alanine carboxypeptidase/D-alanyl-D-alanine-endopeptidase (penicillin-binding protein 4)